MPRRSLDAISDASATVDFLSAIGSLRADRGDRLSLRVPCSSPGSLVDVTGSGLPRRAAATDTQ